MIINRNNVPFGIKVRFTPEAKEQSMPSWNSEAWEASDVFRSAKQFEKETSDDDSLLLITSIKRKNAEKSYLDNQNIRKRYREDHGERSKVQVSNLRGKDYISIEANFSNQDGDGTNIVKSFLVDKGAPLEFTKDLLGTIVDSCRELIESIKTAIVD